MQYRKALGGGTSYAGLKYIYELDVIGGSCCKGGNVNVTVVSSEDPV